MLKKEFKQRYDEMKLEASSSVLEDWELAFLVFTRAKIHIEMEAYNRGFENGWKEGETEGYNEGHRDGRNEGYDEGFYAGKGGW